MILSSLAGAFRHKSLFICTLFVYYSTVVFSQISEGGSPPSFNYPLSQRSGSQAISVPIDFYIEDLREIDQWQAAQGVPMPVAKLVPVDYTMENSGDYTLLPSGEKIWRLHVIAKDANAIMLYYNDFYIPEGGRLFIYNPDKSQLLGAYTHRTHPSGGLFATEFVGGDELILEYVVSETSADKPRITIGEIGYGYNTTSLREYCDITTRASANCNVNINCEEGQAWQNEKKSVCYTVQRIGTKSYMCTASLMNNTAEDFKPLLLTAAHCGFDGTTFATAKEMEQWMFYFNRELEDCSNTSRPKTSNTLIGCSLLTNTGLAGRSDGMLLLLKSNLPANYDVFYNGWDRSGEEALSGACIHHPQGDYKKIAAFDAPAKSYTFRSEKFTCESNAHWNVFFYSTKNGQGITEGGSSGSPLFNEKKLVVGTLSGGSDPPVCYDPYMISIYGKLSYHWDRYKTDSTRMDMWLDPLNTGVKTFPGRFRYELQPSPLNLNVVNLGSSVSLTWDAPKSNETPKGYNVYRNNMKMVNTTLLSFIDNTPPIGPVTYSVSAVYENDEESGFTTSTIYLVKYKAPTDLKAERHGNTNTQVELSWKAPVYEQTIFWGTMQPVWLIDFDVDRPIYFGQLWSVEEIAPLHNKLIKAIQFIPTDNNAHEVCISQGDRHYRQLLGNSSLKTGVMNTINLTTPFVIDRSRSLLISIYLAGERTRYLALCDDGPVENGKGNLVSFDGVNWFRLNEDEEPGEFEINFVLTAIVSSESGVSSLQGTKQSGNPSLVRMKQSGEIQHPGLLHKLAMTIPENSSLRGTKQSGISPDLPLSLRSSVPTAFPEVTKYRVYRSGSFHKEFTPSQLTYTDTYLTNTYYYQVSAFYDQVESEKSETAYITIVNNDFIDASIRISPTHFTNYITLHGYENVSRVEIISVSGKVLHVVTNPNEQINTSSLPPGVYFFLIFDVNNKQRVIKGVKGR